MLLQQDDTDDRNRLTQSHWGLVGCCRGTMAEFLQPCGIARLEIAKRRGTRGLTHLEDSEHTTSNKRHIINLEPWDSDQHMRDILCQCTGGRAQTSSGIARA